MSSIVRINQGESFLSVAVFECRSGRALTKINSK